MSTQLLFYQQAEPVSAEKHRKWSLDTDSTFSFASKVNSVPITAVEFPRAALEYPLVFAGTADQMMPAVVLGIDDNKNLYVDSAGRWTGRYVPAFVRRYPFVFSATDGNRFTLCIDGGFKGWNQDGRGQRLFDDAGERTEYLENILKFLQQYQVEFQRTQSFCRKLDSFDLLEPVQARFTTPGGQRRSLSGFMAISREKLKNLAPKTLADLAATDELELAYLHLQSLNHFEALLAQASRRGTTAAATAGKEARPAAKSPPAAAAGKSATPAARAKKKAGKRPAQK
ncbi:MAG: SapC family protein [Gammaproteobacteria bacterium]|nr:SapC family protein [Gammaproteobacteria bacterium]